MNYPQKCEAIELALRPYLHRNLVEGDAIDKILMLTEQALGAGQEMSHMPGLSDAHEVWLERLLKHKRKTKQESRRN